MCEYYSGSFYEPPSYETCDRVNARADALVRERLGLLAEEEWSSACDDALTSKIIDEAAELVHPRSSEEDER